MMTNGWQVVPLGKVLKRADRYEQKDELQTYHFAGTFSFARGIFSGEVKEGSTFRLDKVQRIKKGDFIFCKIMAWEGAFGIAPEKVDDHVMSGAFVAYEVDQNQINPKFLDYYFKQEPVWKSIGSQSTGTNVRRRSLHPDQFEKATIPLPPLTEQRRIVEHIETLARRVNEAQSLRGEAITLSNILQSRAFDGLLAERKFDYQPLKDILGEPLQNGLSIPASGIGQEGIFFAKVGIVNTGKMNPRETKRVNIELSNNSTFWMKENDIFVSRGNSLELVGRAAVYNGIPANCAFPDLLIRIRVDQTRIDPQYIVYYFQTLEARKYIESQASGTSPSMKKVSQPKLENMRIPVPPLDEQRRIVAYLDDLQAKVNALRELQSRSGEELSALMPSILDKAFKGKL